jgi:histidinol-phosphate/aromatic aminotransferase/cobyric acid decarboxylase-like protein
METIDAKPRPGPDEHSHGGNLRALGAEAGIRASEILDFSANLNPLGPPPWLPEAVAAGLEAVAAYPDPDASRAREAASARFGLPPGRFLFADGADSIILALPRALRAGTVVAFVPGYSGYLRAASRSGARLEPVGLDPSAGFSLGAPGLSDAFASALSRAGSSSAGPCLAFVGAPNNPAGGFMPEDALRDLCSAFPSAFFAVDESFSELAGRPEGLVGRHHDNVIIMRSLTKTFAMPGIRAGYAEASPAVLAAIRAELPAWPLSSFAEEAAIRALGDRGWADKGAAYIAEARGRLVAGLRRLPGLTVHPGPANFILVGLSPGLSARALRAELLKIGIAIRVFFPAEGLGDSWFRLAVRRHEENARLTAALSEALHALAASPGRGGATGGDP